MSERKREEEKKRLLDFNTLSTIQGHLTLIIPKLFSSPQNQSLHNFVVVLFFESNTKILRVGPFKVQYFPCWKTYKTRIYWPVPSTILSTDTKLKKSHTLYKYITHTHLLMKDVGQFCPPTPPPRKKKAGEWTISRKNDRKRTRQKNKTSLQEWDWNNSSEVLDKRKTTPRLPDSDRKR